MRTLLAIVLTLGMGAAAAADRAPSYVVVVSEATHQQEAWREVAAALVEKHAARGAKTIVYRQGPVIADDFILVPNPGRCDPARTYRVAFRAPAARR